jgi:hypothetical protein
MDLDPGAKIARQFCGNGPFFRILAFFSREETVKNVRI